MKFIYSPADGEKREWPFEPNKLLSHEAEAIESVTGMTYAEFGEAFLKGSTSARHALLWVLLRRENRSLKYRAVSFRMDEIDVRFEPDELDALRKAIEERGDSLTDDEREEYLAVLEAAAEVDEPDEDAPPTEEPDAD